MTGLHYKVFAGRRFACFHEPILREETGMNKLETMRMEEYAALIGLDWASKKHNI